MVEYIFLRIIQCCLSHCPEDETPYGMANELILDSFYTTRVNTLLDSCDLGKGNAVSTKEICMAHCSIRAKCTAVEFYEHSTSCKLCMEPGYYREISRSDSMGNIYVDMAVVASKSVYDRCGTL